MPKRSQQQEDQTTALAKWDEELAAAAKASAKKAAERAGGGVKRISVQGGMMTIDGNEVPESTLVGVVSGFTLHNRYFSDPEFDPDNPTSPDCYAFGEEEEEMVPHEDAEDRQAERCDGCPQNEWGTSNKGRGKACKNNYKLMVLPVGNYDAREGVFEPPVDADEVDEAELYSLIVSATNLKAWASYVAKLAAKLLPPWAVYTKIVAKPDKKNQVALSFTEVKRADNELMAALKKRALEAEKEVVAPYPKNADLQARRQSAPKKGGRAPAKSARGRF